MTKENHSRRQFLSRTFKATAAGLVLSLGVSELAFASADQSGLNPGVNHSQEEEDTRATIAYQDLQDNFFNTELGVYEEEKNGKLASVWPFTVAIRANMSLANLYPDDVQLRENTNNLVRGGLEYYWDKGGSAYNSEMIPPYGPPFGPYNHRFFDDNAHIGLVLLDYLKDNGDGWALGRSMQIFDGFIVRGVDKNNPIKTGGIPWRMTPEGFKGDRNLISNAPNAVMGLEIFSQTQNYHYFDWSKGMIAWCDAYLKDRNDHLYYDKIMDGGEIDPTKWSYNQGYMIAAFNKLHLLTGKEEFKSSAESVASNSIDLYGVDGLIRQDPDFNAIYFRYLWDLAKSERESELGQKITGIIKSYANLVWSDPQYRTDNNIFKLPCNASPLNTQAGIVEILAIAQQIQHS
jgi:hypothetical protein